MDNKESAADVRSHHSTKLLLANSTTNEVKNLTKLQILQQNPYIFLLKKIPETHFFKKENY